MKKTIIAASIAAMCAVSFTAQAGGKGGSSSYANTSTLNDSLSLSGSASSIDSHDDNRQYIKNPKIPVHSAIAPGLVTGGNDMCAGSTSVAGQLAIVGASAGWTRESENCNRRKDAAIWFNMGYKMKDVRLVNAGIARLCQGGGNAEAAAAAGIDCGAPVAVPPVAPLYTGEPVNGQTSKTSRTGIPSFDNSSYN